MRLDSLTRITTNATSVWRSITPVVLSLRRQPAPSHQRCSYFPVSGWHPAPVM
nr:MAG TPA: hypothetical protein [Caudoviricetes sp.]